MIISMLENLKWESDMDNPKILAYNTQDEDKQNKATQKTKKISNTDPTKSWRWPQVLAKVRLGFICIYRHFSTIDRDY